MLMVMGLLMRLLRVLLHVVMGRCVGVLVLAIGSRRKHLEELRCYITNSGNGYEPFRRYILRGWGRTCEVGVEM